MLHYADKTIAYLDLTYKGDFANGQIAEYSIADKNLLYTPETFLSDYQSIKASVLEELKAVTYDSTAVRKVLGVERSIVDIIPAVEIGQTKHEGFFVLQNLLANRIRYGRA